MSAVEHLYMHVPFCPRVCPYCAFYVVPAERRGMRALVDALLGELRFRSRGKLLRPRTIYLGGGTPSALGTAELVRLIEGLGDLRAGVEEFTIEVNPTTVSAEKARLLRSLGVNRASLGAQSFDPGVLATLGRQHGPERIARTYGILREAGFRNVGMDLIYGVPGQTPASWRATLEAAFDLGPEHLSAYCLSYEEDTPFFERLRAGAWSRDVEQEAALFLETRERMAGAGYPGYEVSNFARPGFESAHNLAYWRGEDYLGIGPAAVSTVGARRWRVVPDLGRYLAGARDGEWAEDEIEELNDGQRARERIMFGLRMREGVVAEGFSSELSDLAAAGYAVHEGGRWRLTTEGLLRADSVAELFV